MTPLEILGDFITLALASLGIGILAGLICSLILKCWRFISVSAIKETLIIFIFGYIAYCSGELAGMSGIIALLTSGVVMAHYGWYSLSP